jgi:hypothetical protein
LKIGIAITFNLHFLMTFRVINIVMNNNVNLGPEEDHQENFIEENTEEQEDPLLDKLFL